MPIDWNTIIQKTIDSMPAKYRDHLRHIAIVVEDEPNEDVRRQENLAQGEALLGYYQGIPLPERDASYGVGGALPDVITLYINTITEEANELGISVEQVAHETLWHEIGHYFGLDEESIHRLEHQRDNPKTDE
jgi:predicted Zn-dependent protease with MMP-like domain